jgi:hypothetical protein
MKKIVVRKTDNRLVSFGYEDMDRFDPIDFDIIEVLIAELPDELRFCKYENGQVIVDEVYKAQVLQKEAEKTAKRQEALTVINGLTSVIDMTELAQITPKLEWYGDKTFQQVKNYIENNIVDFASAKEYLVKLTLANLANLKLIRVLCAMHLGQM